jgi:hypothetical protein
MRGIDRPSIGKPVSVAAFVIGSAILMLLPTEISAQPFIPGIPSGILNGAFGHYRGPSRHSTRTPRKDDTDKDTPEAKGPANTKPPRGSASAQPVLSDTPPPPNGGANTPASGPPPKLSDEPTFVPER